MILVSSDIKDMLTNITLDKIINILEISRMGGCQYKDEIVKVTKECIQQPYFRFYIQKQGLPMGSLLSSILAEMYMNEFKKILIRSTRYRHKLKMLVRYVDDILIILEGSVEVLKF